MRLNQGGFQTRSVFGRFYYSLNHPLVLARMTRLGTLVAKTVSFRFGKGRSGGACSESLIADELKGFNKGFKIGMHAM